MERKSPDVVVLVQIGEAFLNVMGEAVERWPDPQTRELYDTMTKLLRRIEVVGSRRLN